MAFRFVIMKYTIEVNEWFKVAHLFSIIQIRGKAFLIHTSGQSGPICWIKNGTVDAYGGTQFGDEPLIKVEQK